MTTVLLAIIALELAIIAWRPLQVLLYRAPGPNSDVAHIHPPQHPEEPSAGHTLLLIGPSGNVEHEVMWHRQHVPADFTYAFKVYHRQQQRSDGRWEFTR